MDKPITRENQTKLVLSIDRFGFVDFYFTSNFLSTISSVVSNIDWIISIRDAVFMQ